MLLYLSAGGAEGRGKFGADADRHPLGCIAASNAPLIGTYKVETVTNAPVSRKQIDAALHLRRSTIMDPSSLSRSDSDGLRALVDQACSDPRLGLPCAAAVLVGDGRRYNANLLEYSRSPKRDEGHEDDIYWLASCTKLVTTVACMQLVEKQLLDLDDVSVLEHLCPELKNVKVLQADGTLVAKKTRITLRMLLTHTGEGVSPISICFVRLGLMFFDSWIRVLILERVPENFSAAARSIPRRVQRVFGEHHRLPAAFG